MKNITIFDTYIPLEIIKTSNKNTYFHFRKEGYIDVRLSRFQSVQDCIHYIHLNEELFYKKYMKAISTKPRKKGYQLWGIPYEIVTSNTTYFDHKKRLLYLDGTIDQNDVLRRLERDLIQIELADLIQEFMDHELVDITDVSFTIRLMTTRYGSCNKSKRKISINLQLVYIDPQYLRYVFLHEVTHLVYPHHQADFYQLFAQLCPNYQEYRKTIHLMW